MANQFYISGNIKNGWYAGHSIGYFRRRVVIPSFEDLRIFFMQNFPPASETALYLPHFTTDDGTRLQKGVQVVIDVYKLRKNGTHERNVKQPAESVSGSLTEILQDFGREIGQDSSNPKVVVVDDVDQFGFVAFIQFMRQNYGWMEQLIRNH